MAAFFFFQRKGKQGLFGSQSQVTVHHSKKVMVIGYIASAFWKQREVDVCVQIIFRVQPKDLSYCPIVLKRYHYQVNF